MECKCGLSISRDNLKFELIDTLWNVNDHIEEKIQLDVLELIDTLWNVNIVIL